MLGWVITCHDDKAQDMLQRLEKKHGPLVQCQAVSFWRGPVSYTHLDVYKRQVQCGIGALPGAEEHIMDYEFLRDITGVVKVRMSMGHEVVGHWFNEEVKDNLALLDEVDQAARAVKAVSYTHLDVHKRQGVC